MPIISYDAQSFTLDGRRLWLVGGTIHYARVPRGLWLDRIRAAKQAGLNCIQTPVYWASHEADQGVFNFEDELDIRHFIELLAAEGMYCALRPGPYIGDGYDNGGLPGWLSSVPNVQPRQAGGPFYEGVARYFRALFDQIAGLQATVSLKHAAPTTADAQTPDIIAPGPIITAQVENHWFCDNTKQSSVYLNELTRYLREHGCTVPVTDCNNLWTSNDNTIATWSGTDHVPADLRQLRIVRPNAPRIIAEVPTSTDTSWGGALPNQATDDQSARDLQYRLASILAVGAQFHIHPFHAGTNLGFTGGRTTDSQAAFATTGPASGPPLGEAGLRTPSYLAAKRICVFASQFAQLLANLEPEPQQACIAPTSAAPNENRQPLSLIQQRGAQGSLAFLLKSEDDSTQSAEVLLPTGLTLPVPLGDDTTAWFAFDADLAGVATLTYTNLRPWAFLNKQLLVLFGPAGATGHVCINGSPLQITVPKGQNPVVEQLEDLAVTVLNTEQIDAAYVSPAGLVIGATGLDENDDPLPHKDWPKTILVKHDGKRTKQDATPRKRLIAPSLTQWEQAKVDKLIKGAPNLYEPIEGPTTLEYKGQSFNYGWYKLTLPTESTQTMIAPHAGDRLHIYQNSRLTALIGQGPGAAPDPVKLQLAKDVTILADNLGRFSEGWHTDTRKGLFGHLYAVEKFALPQPTVEQTTGPDLLEYRPFLPYVRQGEDAASTTLGWTVKPTTRAPLIVEINGLPQRAMLICNGEPVTVYDPEQSAGFARCLLEIGEQITGGRNDLQLVVYESHAPTKRPKNPAQLAQHLTVYQTTKNLTDKADWAFAPWTLPDNKEFGRLTKSGPSRPRWFRAKFKVSHTNAPLWFEPIGLTKGQIYINGHNAGRYFVQTHTGQTVPPQDRYYLPEAWLIPRKLNEILIFDEHGKDPTKAKLSYHHHGPLETPAR